MTLLEVILAVVMLGLVTASIAGTLAFTFRLERQEDLRLGAYELANRLILQYLDDDTVIRGMHGQPLAYGTVRYSWELSVDRVAMSMKDPEPGSSRPRAQYKDRFELITARVWLESDDARGKLAALEQGPEPLAELSRILDPSTRRNPDSAERLGKDPSRLMELVTRMGIVPPSGDKPSTLGSNPNRRSGRPATTNK